MESYSLINIKALNPLLFVIGSLPFCIMAEKIPSVGFTSGELLQNNPMLNVPSAPRSKGINEPQRDSAQSRTENNRRPEERGPEIKVNRIIVINLPVSANKEVLEFVEQYRGVMMTLHELRAVAVEITSLLQVHGERLSYAYIPNQKITDGTVQINVMNGHLEAINIYSNTSLVKDTIINNYVEKIYGMKGSIADTERGLLSISDLPGVGELSPFLSSGAEAGGSILNLELKPASRFDGVIVFDNSGLVSSGRNRIGTQVSVNSPLGLGDRLQALAYFSPDFIQINNDSKHGNTVISRVSYDLPLGANSTRAGASFSRVNYKLGGPVLSGLGDGFAEIASLYGSYSLIRSNSSNMTLGASVDLKRMSDKFWGEENTRTASVLTLQLSGNIPGLLLGKPNIIQYQLAYTGGRLNNNDSWNGLNTKGEFFKANQNIKYQQGLTPGMSFSLTISGQQSSKNLDGAEKMALGGPYAVRAYSNSAASADNAWMISPGFNISVPGVDGMTAEIFYDYANGKIQKFSRQPQNVKLRGYGIGLNYDINSNVFINASYAWRDGHDDLLQSQTKAMGWITAGIRF